MARFTGAVSVTCGAVVSLAVGPSAFSPLAPPVPPPPQFKRSGAAKTSIHRRAVEQAPMCLLLWHREEKFDHCIVWTSTIPTRGRGHEAIQWGAGKKSLCSWWMPFYSSDVLLLQLPLYALPHHTWCHATMSSRHSKPMPGVSQGMSIPPLICRGACLLFWATVSLRKLARHLTK
jgi:hypothetical protein